MKHSEIKQFINTTISEVDKLNNITSWILDGHFTWKIVDGEYEFLGRVNAVIKAECGSIMFTYKHDRKTYFGVKRVKSITITPHMFDTGEAYNLLVQFDKDIIKAHNIGDQS